MLLLARKRGESIIINQDIIVKVLSIKGKQILLGIEAPENISVHRDDIRHIRKDEDGQTKEELK